MANELTNSIAEFYKCECFDIFFDVLSQELNMKAIIYFFQTSMCQIDKIIIDQFTPLFNNIKDVACLNTIEGPIINVLRKSFQSTHQIPIDLINNVQINYNYRQIYEKCMINLQRSKIELQKSLKLNNNNIIESFKVALLFNILFVKLSEIMFNCYISDPTLSFDIQSIGQRQQFNSIKNDPIDGFIKHKEECIILRPAVFKIRSKWQRFKNN